MSDIEKEVLHKFKTELSGIDKISQQLSDALCVELEKDSPSVETLMSIIQLKKGFISDDKAG